MKLKQFSTKKLEQAKRNMEHAKSHRVGGLLVTEQKGLDNIIAELERRENENHYPR